MRTIDLLIYAIILTIGLCDVPNYQERAIYLGQKDNVCHFGHYSDQIRLIFNLDGKEGQSTRVLEVWGMTQCWTWCTTDAQCIYPRDYWTYFNEDKSDYMQFDDEINEQKVGNFLVKIVQKSVIRTPAKLGGKWYDCKILGDGQVKHFGIDFPGIPPAEFYISCKLRPVQEENLQMS